MQNIGTPELLILTFLFLFLFGGKKIPEFIRGLGQAVKEYKRAVKDEDKE